MNYRYYSKENTATLHNLVQNKFFSPLIVYLVENQEKRVILRDLKQQFPEKKFEHYLEQLIDNGLINRRERQYELAFPIFNQEYQAEVNQAAAVLFQQLQTMSPVEQQYLMGEEIWHWCFTGNDYFYAQAKATNYKRYEAGNTAFRFVASNQIDQISLATYFFFQRQQFLLPKSYQKLARLIGDVDEEYYFNQAEMILEKVLVGKYKQRRPSIFYDSLIEAKVIKKEEDVYSLDCPLIREKAYPLLFPEITGTSNQRAFIKEQIYALLWDRLLDKGFCYIKDHRV